MASSDAPAAPQSAGDTPRAPERHWFGFRLTALLEIFLFLATALAADALLFQGDAFWQVTPHPFWLIVLLVSVQYGTREGLLAAAACTVALLAVHLPEQTLYQDLYEYLFQIVSRPLLWALAAVLFGELRMRQVRERDQLRADLAASNRRAQSIAAAYERLDDVKGQLEIRVAGQLRTVVSMYKAAKAVETMEPARVIMGALDNVRAIVNPDKCSMFVLSADGELQAGIQNGWEQTDRFSRRFAAESALYREIVGRGRVVCVADPEDEVVLAGQGVLAGPVTNPDTGEVRGMLKIEDMGFLDLNLSTIELFRVLCDWVGAFYANAQRYRQGQQERAIDSETQLYSGAFFPRHRILMLALARRLSFSVSLLVVSLDDPYGLSREERHVVAAALVRAVLRTLRHTDLAFEYGKTDWEFAVVLPIAPIADAEMVAGRLLESFRGELPERIGETPVSVRIEPLAGPDAPTGDDAGRPGAAPAD